MIKTVLICFSGCSIFGVVIAVFLFVWYCIERNRIREQFEVQEISALELNERLDSALYSLEQAEKDAEDGVRKWKISKGTRWLKDEPQPVREATKPIKVLFIQGKAFYIIRVYNN